MQSLLNFKSYVILKTNEIKTLWRRCKGARKTEQGVGNQSFCHPLKQESRSYCTRIVIYHNIFNNTVLLIKGEQAVLGV
jgi:hypothetical protein